MTRSLLLPPTEAPVRRPTLLLGVILVGQFMAVLDAAIVNVALPAIEASLHADGAGLQLIVGGYVLVYACLLVTGARLGDRVGPARAFAAGLGLFTAMSLACGFAGTTGVLIAARCLQGLGAALMVPQVMTLIQRTFAGPARTRALSWYSAVLACGGIVGQVLGGVLVDADLFGLGWRSIFLVNVPVGIVLLVAALRVLPGGRPATPRGLDPVGLATFTPAVALLTLPLVLGREAGWPAWCWIALAASGAMFAVFGWVQRRAVAPLFPLALVRAPGLVPAAAAILLFMSTFGGWLFVATMHLQGGLAYSAQHAGLLFVPNAAVFALVSLNTARIPARWRAPLIPVGLLVAAVTMAGLGLLLRDGSGFGVSACLLFGVMGAGFGLTFTPLMTRAFGRVPLDLATDASGLLVTCVQLGMLLGVAVFGTVYLDAADAGSAHGFGVTAVVMGVVVAVSAGVTRLVTADR